MDPFSLTAGAIGFIALAIQLSGTAKQLCNLWSSASSGLADLKDIIEDLDFLAEVLASLGGSDPYSGHTKSRPAIKVLDKCQRDLYRLEQMSKNIWCENDGGKARRKWMTLKVGFKKDEIAQFQKVLERTKTTLILELMLCR